MLWLRQWLKVRQWQVAATMADRAMVASEQSGLRESRG